MRVIADHTVLHSVIEAAPMVALVVVVLGYLLGSWRRGQHDGWKETIDLQAAELATMRDLNTRLSGDARACKDAIAKLEGIVEQLRQENSELRGMVMLEKVPPALAEQLALNTEVALAQVREVHRDQTEMIRNVLIEQLHPVAQGIARLLTG